MPADSATTGAADQRSTNNAADQRSAATYSACSTFFDATVRHGIRHAVLSPGSRSTALALCADTTPGLRTWIRIDERSAAFFALGLARSTATPTVLVCTSGTAAANYLPAVIEAHYSGVPLLVITADRPPELRDWGAGQTIDQRHIYGSHVNWFFEAPIATELVATARWWSSLAARAVATATGRTPGPVHINWPFREPLEPPSNWAASRTASQVTRQPAPNQATHPPAPNQATHPPAPNQATHPSVHPSASTVATSSSAAEVSDLIGLVTTQQRGIVVAGPMHRATGATDLLTDAVARFCATTGWPLLAEPTSQLRQLTPHQPAPPLVNHFDLLLATTWADAQPPDALVRLGGAPVSKPLRLWLERHQPEHVLIDPAANWTDASFTATSVISVDPAAALNAATDALDLTNTLDLTDTTNTLDLTDALERPRTTSAWADRWLTADAQAAVAIDLILDTEPLTEVTVARELGRSLPAHHYLFASNSMPVRYVNTFLTARTEPLYVHANRGASGIDGVLSTAAGCAAAGHSTTVVLGDLAFWHDLGGLAALGEQHPHPNSKQHPNSATGDAPFSLTVLVVDNGGGQIFSTLPIASVTSPEQFRRLFTTPTSTDASTIAAALSTAFGFAHYHISDTLGLRDLLAHPVPGVRVITVPINATTSHDQRRRITTAVENALGCSASHADNHAEKPRQ